MFQTYATLTDQVFCSKLIFFPKLLFLIGYLTLLYQLHGYLVSVN